MYGTKTDNVIWGEIVHHNYDGQYAGGDWTHYRMMPHGSVDGSTAAMVYINLSPAIVVSLVANIPVAKRTGWVHSTYTYDAPSGVLKSFIDGEIIGQVTISNWQANGANGAYALHFKCLAYYYSIGKIIQLLGTRGCVQQQ